MHFTCLGKISSFSLSLAGWLAGWWNEMLWERHRQAVELSSPVTATDCLETKMRQIQSVHCSEEFNHRHQQEEYWGQQTGAARCHAIFSYSATEPALQQNFSSSQAADGGTDIFLSDCFIGVCSMKINSAQFI